MFSAFSELFWKYRCAPLICCRSPLSEQWSQLYEMLLAPPLGEPMVDTDGSIMQRVFFFSISNQGSWWELIGWWMELRKSWKRSFCIMFTPLQDNKQPELQWNGLDHIMLIYSNSSSQTFENWCSQSLSFQPDWAWVILLISQDPTVGSRHLKQILISGNKAVSSHCKSSSKDKPHESLNKKILWKWFFVFLQTFLYSTNCYFSEETTPKCFQNCRNVSLWIVSTSAPQKNIPEKACCNCRERETEGKCMPQFSYF